MEMNLYLVAERAYVMEWAKQADSQARIRLMLSSQMQ